MDAINKDKSLSFGQKLSEKLGAPQPKWFWGVTGSLLLLSLVGLAEPSGIAFLICFIIICLFGPTIWLMHAVDAFRNSSIRRGFFVLLLPGYLGRYVHKHCTNLFLRRLISAEALGILLIFATGYTKNFDGTIFDDKGASSPEAAWSGFQDAAQKEDVSAAFKYLTPESQTEILDMMVVGAAMMPPMMLADNPAARDEAKRKVEAVFQKHGITLSGGAESMMGAVLSARMSGGTSPTANVEDKAQCIQDLSQVLKEVVPKDLGEESLLVGMRKDFGSPDAGSSTLANLIVNDDTANAQVDGKPIKFKRIDNVWLIDLTEALLGSEKEDVKMNIEWDDATPSSSSRRPGIRAPQATLQELENGVRQTPADPAAWYLLAAKKAAFGKWDESIEDLRRSFALSEQRMATNPNQPNLKTAVLNDSRFRWLLHEKPEFKRSLSERSASAVTTEEAKAKP